MTDLLPSRNIIYHKRAAGVSFESIAIGSQLNIHLTLPTIA
jgi:hypothetical protein